MLIITVAILKNNMYLMLKIIGDIFFQIKKRKNQYICIFDLVPPHVALFKSVSNESKGVKTIEQTRTQNRPQEERRKRPRISRF